MNDAAMLLEAGKQVHKAFVLLDRANDMDAWPSEAQILTKQGLLDAARDAVHAARNALA